MTWKYRLQIMPRNITMKLKQRIVEKIVCDYIIQGGKMKDRWFFIYFCMYYMLMVVDMLTAVGCAVIALILILYIINTYIYLQTDYYYLTKWTQIYSQKTKQQRWAVKSIAKISFLLCHSHTLQL